jgi:hypothetical protein
MANWISNTIQCNNGIVYLNESIILYSKWNDDNVLLSIQWSMCVKYNYSMQ